MDYKVSAFKVIINGVKAYSWIIRSLVNNGCNPNALAELDYDINLVSSQITRVIVNKMRIVLTLVNSNLGLYITYLQN